METVQAPKCERCAKINRIAIVAVVTQCLIVVACVILCLWVVGTLVAMDLDKLKERLDGLCVEENPYDNEVSPRKWLRHKHAAQLMCITSLFIERVTPVFTEIMVFANNFVSDEDEMYRKIEELRKLQDRREDGAKAVIT
jgi:hypothetical protein